MMHWEQSRVGKVSESWAMWPPMEGSRSTRTTWWPQSAMSRAAWMPAMPPPMTSARLVTGTVIGCELFVHLHPLDEHGDDFGRLGGGFFLVFMDPGAVLADVGHLAQVGVEAGGFGGFAEGLFVHPGGAGGNDDAVELMLG